MGKKEEKDKIGGDISSVSKEVYRNGGGDSRTCA